MFNIKKIALAAVMSAAIICAAVPAKAEEAFTYGIINKNKILSESEAGKALRAELDKHLKDAQQQFAKKEKDLIAARDELVKQQAKMSKEDLDKKRKELQEKVGAFQKDLGTRKQSLEAAYQEGMSKLLTEMLKNTADIAKGKNLKAVFSDDAMVLADPQMDITKEVIAELNKNVKKISVTFK